MLTPPTYIYEGSNLQYYLRQTGLESNNGIGTIYSVAPFVQRGHGTGSFLQDLFRIKLVIWSSVKAVGRETLRSGGKILIDVADNTSPDVKTGEIVARRVGESAQNLIQK
jgi:hypothetical protein